MNLDFEGSFGEIIYGKTIYKLPKQLNTVISFEREDDFPLTHSINKQDRIWGKMSHLKEDNNNM